MVADKSGAGDAMGGMQKIVRGSASGLRRANEVNVSATVLNEQSEV